MIFSTKFCNLVYYLICFHLHISTIGITVILMLTKHGFNYIIACARLNVDIFLIIIEIAAMISSIITAFVNLLQ